MGRKGREKEERRKLREAAGSQSQPTESGNGSSWSRRNFLRAAVVGGAGLVAGGLYLETRDDTDPHYVSVKEAGKVYADIYKEISAALKEAKQQQKPLKLFVADDHDSRMSLWYEYLIIKAAASLGITACELEIRSNNKPGYEQEAAQILNNKKLLMKENTYAGSPQNIEMLYPVLKDSGFQTFPIDIAYPSLDAMAQEWAMLYKQTANQRLRDELSLKEDPIADVIPAKSKDVTPNPSFSFYKKYQYLMENEPNKINAIMNAIIPQVDAKIYVEKRELAMVNALSDQNAIVIAGAEHQQPIVEGNKNKVTARVFNVSPFIVRNPGAKTNNWTAWTDSHQAWLESPQNAIQPAIRKLVAPDKDLKDFLDQAIALATKKYHLASNGQPAFNR